MLISPPIFVRSLQFCNGDHCHLVEIFTTWIGIGLVTVRTHLESRLSGSMGRVISLSSIRPSVYFCLHRWCAASSVSAVRHIEPPPDPSILESHQGKNSSSPSPFKLTLLSTFISWRQEARALWPTQAQAGKQPLPLSFLPPTAT